MVLGAATAPPRDYGEFAPLAIQAATRGDALARALVDAAAAGVAALALRVEALGAERISAVGGLGEALRPFLPPEIAARLRPPLYDPTDGAIALVGGTLPEAPT
jgi:glucosamine kinase